MWILRCILLTSILLQIVFLPPAASSKAKTDRNVLVIIGDDVGFETQVYNNSVCKTPNLNKLGKRSVIIKNGYTSVSSCSPSRSAILTGLPQHQNGLYGLVGGPHNFKTFEGVRSLPTLLREGGVKTGIIGKKHVGPQEVYQFDYERTEKNYSYLQVARNITKMKGFVREFFSLVQSKPFLLYIGFNDCHRYGGFYGEFAEKFGNGQPGYGTIPDWTPEYYKPEDVVVPYFLPDTPATRQDIANQYTSMSRLDAGVGMLLKELESHGYLNNTLIIYTADNGIPYQNAKTNLYEPGMGEPFLVSSPFEKQRWGQVSNALASTTDILPTVLDWFGLTYPKYKVMYATVILTGKSLLPVTVEEPKTGYDEVFSSHNFHEVYMYYPMRVMRTKQYRMIHNLNYLAPYPLATDLYASPTFQDTLNRSRHGEPTHWFKTLDQYYYRPEYELFDLINDPEELRNLADNASYADILADMKKSVHSWQMKTNDFWHCYPEGVRYKGGCGPLYNDPPYGSDDLDLDDLALHES